VLALLFQYVTSLQTALPLAAAISTPARNAVQPVNPRDYQGNLTNSEFVGFYNGFAQVGL